MVGLVFRTAVPFGYLLFFAVLVGAAALGIGVILAGLRGRPRRPGLVWVGAGLLGASALVLWANLDAEAVEWNPIIHGSDALAGHWRDGPAILELASDGNYSCSGRACAELGRAGQWAREGDFYVAFDVGGGPDVRWRITERDGHYQFVGGDTQGDPDGWRPRPTFTQLPKSR